MLGTVPQVWVESKPEQRQPAGRSVKTLVFFQA